MFFYLFLDLQLLPEIMYFSFVCHNSKMKQKAWNADPKHIWKLSKPLTSQVSVRSTAVYGFGKWEKVKK